MEKVVDAYMDNYERNPVPQIVLREFVDGGERFRKVFRDLKDLDPCFGVTLPRSWTESEANSG